MKDQIKKKIITRCELSTKEKIFLLEIIYSKMSSHSQYICIIINGYFSLHNTINAFDINDLKEFFPEIYNEKTVTFSTNVIQFNIPATSRHSYSTRKKMLINRIIKKLKKKST